MNNYPDGFIPKVEQKAVDLVCSVCGYMWEAVILTEFCFSWFADDEYGNICPECGEEGADGVKITDQKHGRLNEADRLELAQLLLKAGYTVRIGKEKPPGKKTNVYFIEYEEGNV